ncbi:MAG TPA: NAD(P)/FAD-dependent oxidoreductase [Thermoplasmata archaeon]
MERVEVLVVGAGPAGSTVADRLARRGHEVLVLEEHQRVGHPVQCAGLVSARVLELAGSRSMVRTAVHGATVFSPSLRAVSFKAPEPRAFVIDRAGLDVHLADRAARAGARFATGVRFDGLDGAPNGAAVVRATASDGTERRYEAQLVIGADGVTSGVARAFRLRRPVEILPAFEAEFPQSPGDPDQVEVYLGNLLSPGLFGWWIPDGAGGARIGVAVGAGSTTARAYFDRLVATIERRHGRPLRNPTGFIVSGIPIGTVPRLHGHRVLLVGDAAAQVKPLSGGGIFTGMRGAELAAQVADAALRSGEPTSAALAPYDALWRAELGDEFQKALYLRRLFTRLSDPEFERVLEALEGSGMRESIVAFGDIDFPTHVARQLLRQSPSLVRLFPKALGAWLGGSGSRAPDLDLGPRRQA